MIREIESEFEVAKDRHNKIIVCTTADATRYNDEDVFGQLRSNFHKLWAALADELPKASTKLEELSMQSTMMHSSLKENEVKIPTVELPHFNGRYEDWRNYINLFDVLIHTNTSLESIHKLKYFWTTLEGDALDIIKHLPLNGSSYSIARELLKKRFEHKRKLVNNYLNRLFKAPVIQNESSNSIKQVINTINDCTNSLKQLDLSIPDYVIIYNIVDILPIETVKDWEKSLGASIDLPQLEQFMDFLETKFRTLESTEAVNENHLKQQKTFAAENEEHDSTSANRNFHVQSSSKLLGTARIKVVNLYGCSNFERALVDPCSTDNYITSSTANKLKLQKYFAPTEVLTMGNNEPSKCSHRVNFRIESLQGKFTMEISAAIVDNITTNMPETELPWNNFGSLVQLPLSDPFFNRPLPINILLGVDVHALIKLDKSERYGKLIAENTLLGYLIRGSAEENIYNRQRSTVFLTKSMTHDSINKFRNFGRQKRLQKLDQTILKKICVNKYFKIL
uniref:Uncharacterized protein n=1 Tax=Megaselia scalaris TaxID=36166 RepID=T1GFZ7_MEGSC